ncbi:MAG: signal peptidase II [Chloroflexi bacterium]|nr:signal peptidase II [Chloroflexota bacterium]
MSQAPQARPLWGAFAAIVATILVVDQATKAWITSELGGGRVISFAGGALRLIYSQNNGAVFGLFRGQVAIFALLSLGVIALLVGLHGRSGRSPYMTLTLGLLLGGAIGNAIDRIRLGYVVDFVDGGLGSLRFYTFNVGDACISLAILLLVALAIRPSLAGGQAPADAPPPLDAPPLHDAPPPHDAPLPAVPPAPGEPGPGDA